MSRHPNSAHDPLLDTAREAAEGVEVFSEPTAVGLTAVRKAEDAQGVRTFANPDGLLSLPAAEEAEPGHESLTGVQAGLDSEGDDYRMVEDDWRT